MTDLAAQIEVWLLLQPGWISAADLCARYGIQDRALRDDGNDPGLVSLFAISGPLGFRHVRNATRDEHIAFKRRLRRHSIRQLRRVSILDRVRHNVTVPGPGYRLEADSGQAIFKI